MDDRQLDLFSSPVVAPASESRPGARPLMAAGDLAVGDLDDAALVAAFPSAGLLEVIALASEAGRRQLAAAIPALEAVVRRHAGFGARGPVIREQAAALEALADIGGALAAGAVARAIVRQEIQGATLASAMAAAARLRATFPQDVLMALLGHDDPAVRASACACARATAAILAQLVGMLNDEDVSVRAAAARALGRMGQVQARPLLVRLLATSPSAEVVDAIAPVADENAVVLLGRLARSRPDLMQPVLEALDGCDHPRAPVVAAGLRKPRAGG